MKKVIIAIVAAAAFYGSIGFGVADTSISNLESGYDRTEQILNNI